MLYQFGTKDASGRRPSRSSEQHPDHGHQPHGDGSESGRRHRHDGARTAMATRHNVFAQNDRLAVTITSIGTTRRQVLKAVIPGRYT
ncbi:hypothetical protein GS937_01345 [Rhodococcus hoagii]|nr:hypothetical protein [Prescottella equi]